MNTEQFQISLGKYVHSLHFGVGRDLFLAEKRDKFTHGLGDAKDAVDANHLLQLSGKNIE